jgi:hypothetical protein
MRYPSYIEAVRHAPVMLTDGGIETRLIYQDQSQAPRLRVVSAAVRSVGAADAGGAVSQLSRYRP